MRIGFFEHWHQPPYKFVDFLPKEVGYTQLIHRYVPTINACMADITLSGHIPGEEIPLQNYDLHDYIRVEIEGMNQHWCCNSTPIWLK